MDKIEIYRSKAIRDKDVFWENFYIPHKKVSDLKVSKTLIIGKN